MSSPGVLGQFCRQYSSMPPLKPSTIISLYPPLSFLPLIFLCQSSQCSAIPCLYKLNYKRLYKLNYKRLSCYRQNSTSSDLLSNPLLWNSNPGVRDYETASNVQSATNVPYASCLPLDVFSVQVRYTINQVQVYRFNYNKHLAQDQLLSAATAAIIAKSNILDTLGTPYQEASQSPSIFRHAWGNPGD